MVEDSILYAEWVDESETCEPQTDLIADNQNPFPVPVQKTRVLAALFIGLTAVAAIPVANHTYPVAYNMLISMPLDEFFSTCKQFASLTTILTVLACIGFLDNRRAQAIIYLVLAFALTGLANETIKQITGRMRPEFTVRREKSGDRFLQRHIEANSNTPVRVSNSDQWLLFKPNRPYLDDAFASFPSGHSSAAFVLAAFLCMMYGRVKWLWLLLAAGCALARVRYRRHFPEDVLMGGALGFIIAQWVFSWEWPAAVIPYFSRLKQSDGATLVSPETDHQQRDQEYDPDPEPFIAVYRNMMAQYDEEVTKLPDEELVKSVR